MDRVVSWVIMICMLHYKVHIHELCCDIYTASSNALHGKPFGRL